MMRKKVGICMKISTIAYSSGQGIKNIKRNKLFSLASVGTIAACIFLMGLFYSIIINVRHMVEAAEDSVCVTVFFNTGISDDEINDIGELITKRIEVSRIEFTSADEAWEKYKQDYFGDNIELAEGFKEDNPLKNSAYYEIYLNDLSMQSALKTYLKTIDGIRDVRASDITANTLSDFAKVVGYISVAIILILLAVGIFLISNTVMIGITVRREEIRIMKLIGSTDFFVRFPFIVEGVIIGLIGAVIPVAILTVIYNKAMSYLITEFISFTSKISFVSSNEIFAFMVPVALIIGAGIGFIGSMITIRKHLRV